MGGLNDVQSMLVTMLSALSDFLSEGVGWYCFCMVLCVLVISLFSGCFISSVEKGGKNMAALVAAIGTFFSGVMGMVSTLTTTIVGDDLLVLGVVAVPLVGISVGLLSRLFRQRV